MRQPKRPEPAVSFDGRPVRSARLARSSRPADLRGHDWLRFVLGDSVHGRWRFSAPGGETLPVEVAGSRVSDDGGLVREWALASLGLAYKSRLDVADDLAAGRLVALLPGWQGESAPLHWMAVGCHRLTPALRRLAQHLADRCAALGKFR